MKDVRPTHPAASGQHGPTSNHNSIYPPFAFLPPYGYGTYPYGAPLPFPFQSPLPGPSHITHIAQAQTHIGQNPKPSENTASLNPIPVQTQPADAGQHDNEVDGMKPMMNSPACFENTHI